MTQASNFHALILAGGAGTRFWPASRVARPKQLLALCGDLPLIRQTALRMLEATGSWDRIWVATGAHLIDATRAILPELSETRFIVEPVPRNTAPCIAWASAKVERSDPGAILAVVPSDPFIANEAKFQEVLVTAIRSATEGAITTIGIRPTHPETGYGYIEVDPDHPADAEIRAVRRFVEKPDRARAEQFLTSGNFLWNAGMFIFRVSDMQAAVSKHLPEVAALVSEIEGGDANTAKVSFPKMPSVSIDVGVMEKMDRLAVVAGDFGWSDVGSWNSAWELAEKDDRENAGPPESVFIDGARNYIMSDAAEGKVIAVVGMDDVVVVDTKDALLIVRRKDAQDVKKVVDELKRRGGAGT